MIKFTLETIKNIFAENNCVLLEETYVNNSKPLKFLCFCGREDTKSLSTFKQNPQCRYCSGQALDFDFVKKTYEENNCILLEDSYKNNSVKMKFICYCGREDSKNFHTFKNVPKCRFCAEKIRSSQRAKSFEEIKALFDANNHKLLSTVYIPGQKLKYICDCGNVDFKNLYKYIEGNRCKECGLKKQANSRRFTQEYVENFFTKNGCKLLSEYTGEAVHLDYICKCGSQAKTTFHTFKKCKNCRECGMKKKLLDLDTIYKFIDENNLNLISLHTYKNTSHGKLLFRCDCGNEYERDWNYLKTGRGNYACKDCSKKLKSAKLTGENHPSWIENRDKVEFRRIYAKKIHSMLAKCYQRFKLKKEIKSFEILGYTQYDLGFHITNHPNYKNAIKNNDMHIDHIFPIQAFIDFGLCETEHIKIINSLENLQPLDAFDNLSKSDKYDKEEFIKFLQTKGFY
jgi:hypothetical protein